MRTVVWLPLNNVKKFPASKFVPMHHLEEANKDCGIWLVFNMYIYCLLAKLSAPFYKILSLHFLAFAYCIALGQPDSRKFFKWIQKKIIILLTRKLRRLCEFLLKSKTNTRCLHSGLWWWRITFQLLHYFPGFAFIMFGLKYQKNHN